MKKKPVNHQIAGKVMKRNELRVNGTCLSGEGRKKESFYTE